jgi:hypothetical protein
MFLAALQAKKSQLKPTTTIVRPHPCIQTGMEHLGLTALGGEIEKEHVEEEKTTSEWAHETAKALLQAKHAVIYTGAGVSTATGISDYRGPNGVWTSLATGKIPDDHYDITSSNPSFTHMVIDLDFKIKKLKSFFSPLLVLLSLSCPVLLCGSYTGGYPLFSKISVLRIETQFKFFQQKCSKTKSGPDLPKMPFWLHTKYRWIETQCHLHLSKKKISFKTKNWLQLKRVHILDISKITSVRYTECPVLSQRSSHRTVATILILVEYRFL